jgi:uncharacterized PurR-regulated membrane protein YhhQ (DUF165 family)
MFRHINAIIYVTAVLLANYTAVWFIPFPIFGQVAVGTLIFGITFTQRDRMHRNGRRYVYSIIGLTAFLAGLESLLIDVPARIIVASLIAIVLSEAADTEVYQRFIKRSWYTRVAASNAVSIPIDTLLFNLIAFYGVFPIPMLISIMFGEIIVKALTAGGAALWKSSTVTRPMPVQPQSP